jgi:hypothetical protein
VAEGRKRTSHGPPIGVGAVETHPVLVVVGPRASQIDDTIDFFRGKEKIMSREEVFLNQ